MRGTVGVAPGTTTLKLPDGSSVALADWIDDKMYGCVEFSDGQSAPVEAFASGRSQSIPGGARVQTRVDTNIPRNGDSGLPKDWEMLIYGIGVRPIRAFNNLSPVNASVAPVISYATIGYGLGAQSEPVSFATIFGIDRSVFMSFEYNGKAYSAGVMTDYPAGVGFWSNATTTNFELVNNGVPSPRDRVALVLPIHMRENLGFKCCFQPEAALRINQASDLYNTKVDSQTAAVPTILDHVDVKVYLYGLIKRTVV